MYWIDVYKRQIYDDAAEVKVLSGEDELTGSDIVKGGDRVIVSYGEKSREYTIAASSDNELKETVYMVSGKTIDIPSTEKNPTTVSAVKQNVGVNATATVNVLKEDEVLANTDTIADGMTPVSYTHLDVYKRQRYMFTVSI